MPIFREMVTRDVSWTRRVHHSTTNYFSSIGKDDLVGLTVNTASNALGTTGGVVGVLGVAGSAAAATAFAATIAGPQIAITAGVLGLALMAKSAYSNREAAHKVLLSKYAWTFIDAQAPSDGRTFTKDGLQDAAGAAMTLMDDGKSQVKLLGTKLQEANKKFTDVVGTDILPKIMVLETMRPAVNRLDRTGAAWAHYNEIMQGMISELKAKWAKECEADGAVFEYVRRCAHVGNYVQAPHIVSLAMQEAVCQGSVIGVQQADYFANWPTVTALRKTFADLEAKISPWLV